jgi:hypothetical protein
VATLVNRYANLISVILCRILDPPSGNLLLPQREFQTSELHATARLHNWLTPARQSQRLNYKLFRVPIKGTVYDGEI